jgi:predicted transcriptional regulator
MVGLSIQLYKPSPATFKTRTALFNQKAMKMGFLEGVEKVAGKLAPGRTPTFTEVHIIKVLESLAEEKPFGRKRLSKILGLGEGETRTLVRHLRNEDLIHVSRAGIVLSELGKELLSDLRSNLSKEVEVPESSLTVAPSNMAVLVKSAAESVKYGVEQRDAAIKAGALGATTLVFRDDRLTMPEVGEDVFRNIQSIHDLLVAKLKPEEGDVVIIGSADDRWIAEFAAKTAALKLLKSKR